MDFKNKVVLVTGASRGIGRATALAFARSGARLAVHYHRNKEAAEKTIGSLPGGPHRVFCCDISDPAEARPLIDGVVEEFGRLDVLVNNAGVFRSHVIQEVPYQQWLEVWQQTLATNLQGPANLMYWAAQQMIKQGGGRIVNISSRGAFRGEPEAPAYGASKAGLNALSQSLAQALAPENIFVTVVAPGFVETDMVAEALAGPQGESIRRQSPLGRVARPEEVARVILFLASEDADYLAGAIVDVNGASYLRS
ncbi:SDR family NAD(P)-dependent oxidoreductase [Candidatus Zixiibacteriota bacterium]